MKNGPPKDISDIKLGIFQNSRSNSNIGISPDQSSFRSVSLSTSARKHVDTRTTSKLSVFPLENLDSNSNYAQKLHITKEPAKEAAHNPISQKLSHQHLNGNTNKNPFPYMDLHKSTINIQPSQRENPMARPISGHLRKKLQSYDLTSTKAEKVMRQKPSLFVMNFVQIGTPNKFKKQMEPKLKLISEIRKNKPLKQRFPKRYIKSKSHHLPLADVSSIFALWIPKKIMITYIRKLKRIGGKLSKYLLKTRRKGMPPSDTNPALPRPAVKCAIFPIGREGNRQITTEDLQNPPPSPPNSGLKPHCHKHPYIECHIPTFTPLAINTVSHILIYITRQGGERSPQRRLISSRLRKRREKKKEEEEEEEGELGWRWGNPVEAVVLGEWWWWLCMKVVEEEGGGEEGEEEGGGGGGELQRRQRLSGNAEAGRVVL
ncbi:hypothetical protein M9H77_16819 [Catharanthus roseus]|uniref:Uncharacterized protein n=1 Tax=Catharanthus roseus TaxID=4058 RepID=A0ACC0B2W7_CATRO|nr:hypothetical protein M9H77_16819 [Catharanthus roseus]